jgi:flagellar protein FliS
MAVLSNPYDKYKSNAVMTASRGELTLMLYDAALKFCNQAIEAIEKGNNTHAHTLIVKVETIIEELESTLNFDYEIAKQMFTMYDYLFRRLCIADGKKDVEILKEVSGLIREFRDAWKEAMKIARAQGMQV